MTTMHDKLVEAFRASERLLALQQTRDRLRELTNAEHPEPYPDLGRPSPRTQDARLVYDTLNELLMVYGSVQYDSNKGGNNGA